MTNSISEIRRTRIQLCRQGLGSGGFSVETMKDLRSLGAKSKRNSYRLLEPPETPHLSKLILGV